MEIFEKIKTNKSDDYLTEIQKICLHKLQSSPLPNPKSELWRLSNKSKLSTFLDYSVNEKDSKFDDHFILLSREIHFLNDKRANIKLEINNHTGSKIKEIKEYTKY